MSISIIVAFVIGWLLAAITWHFKNELNIAGPSGYGGWGRRSRKILVFLACEAICFVTWYLIS